MRFVLIKNNLMETVNATYFFLIHISFQMSSELKQQAGKNKQTNNSQQNI